ncbi:MAG: (Fe-S)-binding protein [Deltaproteobacteria bacterium]|nr:(Fe-S)-binding protein [Deltaproteobacteria bacterium]
MSADSFMPGTPLFYALFWGVFLITLGLLAYRLRQLWQYMFLGQKETGKKSLIRQTWDTIVYVISQLCQLKNFRIKDWAPLGHALMVWGFFVSVVFYFFFIILTEGFGLMALEETQFYFYSVWVMDFMAVFIFVGAAWGIIRRYIIRPERLQGEQTTEAMIILLSVLTHPVTYVFEIGAKITLGHAPAGLGHTLLPPVSAWISNVFTAGAGTEGWYLGFLWAHWLTVVFVMAIIPYTRYLHVIASIFNGILRNQPRTVLKPIDLETAESFGVNTIDQLTWKQNLDLYACVVCGNCQELCPANISGKQLNPKKLIQDLKNHLLKVGPELVAAKAKGEPAPANPNVALADNVILLDEIWACTTCGACDEVCPVWVDHIDKIVDLRRNLVMEQSSMPETAEGALKSIEARGHPWRGTTLSRTDWAEGLDVKVLADDQDVDILFWVGCTEALEERSTKVAQAVAKLLKLAGVNFGILGAEESCCGEPARRLGNEYLFQMQAAKNIEILKNYGVKRIVTACPHCYNTIKNEYPQFGGNFEVIHHTELFAQLIKEGKLKLNKVMNEQVTYHDACYLGRYNDIYQQPRQIIKTVPGIKMAEMERNRRRGFCCGGGGGHMWLEEQEGNRINEMRTEQALETKAQTVITACPFCLQMFEDGIKAKAAEEQLKVTDIAELLAARIEE